MPRTARWDSWAGKHSQTHLHPSLVTIQPVAGDIPRVYDSSKNRRWLLLVLLGVQHDVPNSCHAHCHFDEGPERMEARQVPDPTLGTDKNSNLQCKTFNR